MFKLTPNEPVCVSGCNNSEARVCLEKNRNSGRVQSGSGFCRGTGGVWGVCFGLLALLPSALSSYLHPPHAFSLCVCVCVSDQRDSHGKNAKGSRIMVFRVGDERMWRRGGPRPSHDHHGNRSFRQNNIWVIILNIYFFVCFTFLIRVFCTHLTFFRLFFCLILFSAGRLSCFS